MCQPVLKGFNLVLGCWPPRESADQTGRLRIDRAGWIFRTNQLRKMHLDAVSTSRRRRHLPCTTTAARAVTNLSKRTKRTNTVYWRRRRRNWTVIPTEDNRPKATMRGITTFNQGGQGGIGRMIWIELARPRTASWKQSWRGLRRAKGTRENCCPHYSWEILCGELSSPPRAVEQDRPRPLLRR